MSVRLPITIVSGRLTQLASTDQVGVNDGAVGTPGLCFASEPSTGLYRIGTHQVGLAVNGVLTFNVNATVITPALIINGVAGGVGGPAFSFTSDPDTGLYSIAANTLGFATGGVEAMRIDPSGNVGIGATSFGTSAAKVLSIANGTAPTAKVAGTVQLVTVGGLLYAMTDQGELCLVSSPTQLHNRILNQAWMNSVPTTLNGVSFGFGGALFTVGTAGAHSTGQGSNWLKITTGATSGNTNFVELGAQASAASVGTVALAMDPELTWLVQTDSANSGSGVRTQIGFFSGDPHASSTPALSYCMFRYDTAVDSGLFWRTATDNGSGTPTVTITTFALNNSLVFRCRIVCNQAAGTVNFYINDTLVASHTTTLPALTTLLVPAVNVTTLTAATRAILVSSCTMLNG